MGVADLKTKGREAFKRKRYELAIAAYLEYLQFEPNDGEAVEGFFQAAAKANESKGKSLFGGLARVGGKDPKKRMASCFRALAKNPKNKSVLMSLGEAALLANAPAAGAAAYKRAADLDPDDSTPWKRLGEALGRNGNIQEALDALRRAVEIDPRDQEAQKLRKNLAAEGALKISGYETAKSSRELIRDKQAAEELEQEVRMQLTPEHAASEIERMKTELEAEPTSRGYVRLADLQLSRQDEAGAKASFQKAIELEPDNYDLTVRLGDLELRAREAAFKSAKQALAANPDDASVKARHDEAMKALVEGSLEEYGRRVREHPLDLGERFRYGRWLLQAGQVDEALAEFQQTVRDPNRKTESLRFQARCFAKKNLIGLALKKMEEAVQDFPTLASPKAKDVYYEYADMLERKEEREKARDVFERIVESDASYRDALKRLETLSA